MAIIKSRSYPLKAIFILCAVVPVSGSAIFPSVHTLSPVTPVLTVAPNTYYFGEWNTGNLMRLELTQGGSVVSTSQVYTQNGGIIAVEMNANSKLYFTSPDAIYSYDLQQPAPPSAPPSSPSSNVPTLILLGIVILVVGLIGTAYRLRTVRYRKKYIREISLPE